MKSFSSLLNEIFDSPYAVSIVKQVSHTCVFKIHVPDGKQSLIFYCDINNASTATANLSTGLGHVGFTDEYHGTSRVYGSVMECLRQFSHLYPQIKHIEFGAVFTAQARMYRKLLQRFAHQHGWSFRQIGTHDFSLERPEHVPV